MNRQPTREDIVGASRVFSQGGGEVEPLPDGPTPLAALGDHERTMGRLADALELVEVYSRPAVNDLSGEQFGHLTATRFVGMTGAKRNIPIWWFRCACGSMVKRTVPAIRNSLRRGATPHCGSYCPVGAKYYKKAGGY